MSPQTPDLSLLTFPSPVLCFPFVILSTINQPGFAFLTGLRPVKSYQSVISATCLPFVPCCLVGVPQDGVSRVCVGCSPCVFCSISHSWAVLLSRCCYLGAAPPAWQRLSPAALPRSQSGSLKFFAPAPPKSLQNNTVHTYLNVYVTVDVAGVFLKSFYRDNRGCLHWRFGDLVAGKGWTWKRGWAQSWVENIPGEKIWDLGKKHETEEQYIYFQKMLHPKVESSEFTKAARGQAVSQKWKLTGPVK